MEIQLDKLKDFLNNFVQKVMNMEKGFNNNFNVISNEFDKINNKIKEQEKQIKSLVTIINDEMIYYKDRREQPINLSMYAGGVKTRKPKKTKKQKKTRKL